MSHSDETPQGAMTEKPNSIPNKCADGKCVPKYEPGLGNSYCVICHHWICGGISVAEPAEPSVSPLLATSGGSVQLHQAMSQVVSAEPTAEGLVDLELARKIKLIGERYNWDLSAFLADVKHKAAAPQPVAGEGPQVLQFSMPKRLMAEMRLAVAAGDVPKITELYYQMWPEELAQNQQLISGSANGQKPTLPPEGTPKLEEIARNAAKRIAGLVTSTHQGCETISILRGNIERLGAEVITESLCPFITPACPPPNGKMEISTKEYGNLLAIWQPLPAPTSVPQAEPPKEESK